ncbi:WD40 repeat protein [Pseudomonas syringae pv. actinidiae]|uniref:WD40 repeat protein n=1 Tax=Pseudomonas syringae pv. actinidiae TaxID=103796 RepID=A0A2V0QWJ0_PSESF|nr:WD40 repeat protein [Pseudomonas syringae pv. actinidiae]GBH17466.1 WD40 repeat protein [Pseudomonas syringae pv. actinidiae]
MSPPQNRVKCLPSRTRVVFIISARISRDTNVELAKVGVIQGMTHKVLSSHSRKSGFPELFLKFCGP